MICPYDAAVEHLLLAAPPAIGILWLLARPLYRVVDSFCRTTDHVVRSTSDQRAISQQMRDFSAMTLTTQRNYVALVEAGHACRHYGQSDNETS